jgi:hypothetical protein
MAAKREIPKPLPTRAGYVRSESSLLPAQHSTLLPSLLQLDAEDANAPEHRQFPRAKLGVSFAIWIGEGKDRTFSASLKSVNLSVSGAFLQSTFFLPVGTQLNVSFMLEDGGEPVRARGEILRQQQSAANGDESRSGMGMRFVEFFEQTEVTLARLFLGPTLQLFAETYLSSDRAQNLDSELDRVVDALAAWELQKVTSPADPWRGKGPLALEPEPPPATTRRR